MKKIIIPPLSLGLLILGVIIVCLNSFNKEFGQTDKKTSTGHSNTSLACGILTSKTAMNALDIYEPPVQQSREYTSDKDINEYICEYNPSDPNTISIHILRSKTEAGADEVNSRFSRLLPGERQAELEGVPTLEVDAGIDDITGSPSLASIRFVHDSDLIQITAQKLQQATDAAQTILNE